VRYWRPDSGLLGWKEIWLLVTPDCLSLRRWVYYPICVVLLLHTYGLPTLAYANSVDVTRGA